MDDKKAGDALDFFNLNSDEEEDETPVSSSENFEKQLQKWDWDRPENFHLYYKYNTRKPLAKQTDQKRTLIESYSDEEASDLQKKHKSEAKQDNFFIDRSKNESNTEPRRLLFNLNGHKASVNRVDWCKRSDHRETLLSSSIDR
jgi:hypothetical protein